MRTQGHRRQLKNRLKGVTALNEEVQNRYFSHWIYAAVHVATTIPALNDARTIARALGVEEILVQETLEFLVNVGLIERSKKGFSPGAVRLHLPHDSHLIFKHHINWRLQAMKAIDNKREANLHDSSVVSISMDDFHIIRDMLLKAIDQAKEKIRASKEETLDFFALTSSEETGASKGAGK